MKIKDLFKKAISVAVAATMVFSIIPSLGISYNEEVLADVSAEYVGTDMNVLNNTEFEKTLEPNSENGWSGISKYGVDTDSAKGYLHKFSAQNWGNSNYEASAYQIIFL